jgi:cytochrome c biogenesis protein
MLKPESNAELNTNKGTALAGTNSTNSQGSATGPGSAAILAAPETSGCLPVPAGSRRSQEPLGVLHCDILPDHKGNGIGGKPSTPHKRTPSERLITIFASVKLTVTLISLIAASVLIGAWCPQESQAGQEKIIEQFGETMALNLIQWGVADIFHSPWFLMLIGLLTLNMVACSCQRVFPKVRLLKLPMPFLGAKEIERMPYHATADYAKDFDNVVTAFRRRGYIVRRQDNKLTAEFGKFAKLAATVEHIGLLTLLLGVTITSWTGFSGFKPVRLGDDLSFGKSEHSKLWIGKLPSWKVHVDATRREDYESGDAKQWYSDLSVVSPNGKILSKQQISVNNPLLYEGVDVYQSSWGLDQLVLSFNGDQRSLQLRPMGKRFAAFLPLDQTTIFIFSLKNQTEPLRLFAKRLDWKAPRLLVELPVGQSTMLGTVKLTYEKVLPVTGLQYKCDPGLPITYTAFGFIITGVLLAMIPHRLAWATLNGGALTLGGRSVKAKVGFERSMNKMLESLGAALPATESDEERSTPEDEPAVAAKSKASEEESSRTADVLEINCAGERQLVAAGTKQEVDS